MVGNKVDVSEEAVERELIELEGALAGDDAVVVAEAAAAAEAEAAAGMEAAVVAAGVRVALGIGGVAVGEDLIVDFSEKSAALISKYFPAGVFGFLAEFGEELAFAGAAFTLYSAIKEGGAERGE